MSVDHKLRSPAKQPSIIYKLWILYLNPPITLFTVFVPFELEFDLRYSVYALDKVRYGGPWRAIAHFCVH